MLGLFQSFSEVSGSCLGSGFAGGGEEEKPSSSTSPSRTAKSQTLNPIDKACGPRKLTPGLRARVPMERSLKNFEPMQSPNWGSSLWSSLGSGFRAHCLLEACYGMCNRVRANTREINTPILTGGS